MEIRDLEAASGSVPTIEEAGRAAQVRADNRTMPKTRASNSVQTSAVVDSELADKIAETMNDIDRTATSLRVYVVFSITAENRSRNRRCLSTLVAGCSMKMV